MLVKYCVISQNFLLYKSQNLLTKLHFVAFKEQQQAEREGGGKTERNTVFMQ
jgi:hypothetical protein